MKAERSRELNWKNVRMRFEQVLGLFQFYSDSSRLDFQTKELLHYSELDFVGKMMDLSSNPSSAKERNRIHLPGCVWVFGCVF